MCLEETPNAWEEQIHIQKSQSEGRGLSRRSDPKHTRRSDSFRKNQPKRSVSSRPTAPSSRPTAPLMRAVHPSIRKLGRDARPRKSLELLSLSIELLSLSPRLFSQRDQRPMIRTTDAAFWKIEKRRFDAKETITRDENRMSAPRRDARRKRSRPVREGTVQLVQVPARS